MPRRKSSIPQELILCACGCGQTLQKYAKKLSKGNLVERKYIHGHNAVNKKMPYLCDCCKKEIIVPAYQFKRQKHHFCSYECSGMYSRSKITLQCAYCKGEFAVILKRKDTALFCSKKCQNESTKVIRECNYCKKELIRAPCHNAINVYCNRRCQHKWLSENFCGEKHPLWEGGGGSYRAAQWREKRKAALTRDGYKCRICGSAEKLCVHHIKKYKEFADKSEAHQLKNLITLCSSCHAKAEPRRKNHKLNDILKKTISANPYQMVLF